MLFAFMSNQLLAKQTFQIKKSEQEQINMDFSQKKLLGKVGSICMETPNPDTSMGAEIFLEMVITQTHISITEKTIETISNKDHTTVERSYSKPQEFTYQMVNGKLMVDNTDKESNSDDYQLISLEFKNNKIIGEVESLGKRQTCIFWQDITSIYNGKLRALIDNIKHDAQNGHIYMRATITKNNISVGTGMMLPPCGTINYHDQEFPYTQQVNGLMVYYTKSQKAAQQYRLLHLFLRNGKIFGEVEMPNHQIKEFEFGFQ